MTVDDPELYPPDVYSRTSVSEGGEWRRLTWNEIAEDALAQVTQLGKWRTICQDLDRCEHGRHEGDECYLCGGPSKGNDVMPLSRLIGYDISGIPYFVPERFADNGRRKSDPDAWKGER